jgi:hypothetical protein
MPVNSFILVFNEMKRFLISLIGALVVVFVLDRAVGFMLKTGYEHTRYGAIGRKNEIVNRVKSDIIILGSSRALHHYVPQVISDSTGLTCYNCGQGGQGIIYHYALLRAMTERYMPKMIVYELTYAYDVETSDNSRFLGEIRTLNHRGCADSILWRLGSMEKLKMMSRIYPYNSLAFHIVGDHWQKKNLTAQHGYIPKFGRLNPAYTKPKAPSKVSTVDSVKLSFLKRFISEFASQTKLVVFVSPEYGTKAGDRNYSMVQQLCQEHGVAFVNRNSDPDISHNPSLFIDNVHLNDEGATRYTRSICGIIRDVLNAVP